VIHVVTCGDNRAAPCGGTVGKYGVLTSSFEACALPALSLPVDSL